MKQYKATTQEWKSKYLRNEGAGHVTPKPTTLPRWVIVLAIGSLLMAVIFSISAFIPSLDTLAVQAQNRPVHVGAYDACEERFGVGGPDMNNQWYIMGNGGTDGTNAFQVQVTAKLPSTWSSLGPEGRAAWRAGLYQYLGCEGGQQ